MPPKQNKSGREYAISSQNATIWKSLYLQNGKSDQAEIWG